MAQKPSPSRDSGEEKQVVESRRSFLGFVRQHSEDSAPVNASHHFPRMHSAFTDPTASRQTASSFQFTASQDMDKKETKPVFVDADAMKAKVRQNLRKRQHNVKELYKDKGVWQAIAKNPRFEVLTLAVIALNSIWIAVDTDLNDSHILLNAHPVFQVAEHFFCAFFFFEWTTRYMAFKRKRDCLKDAWFLFDSGLVLMMVSETWVMTLLTLFTGAGAGGGAGNTSVLRIARLLRLTRMARMARLLRAMPELMILIKGMLAASRSVVFTLLLLVILMYVFAIAMTQLMVETPTGHAKFRTVLLSMYTLMLHGALLDDVAGLERDLRKDSIVCTIIFFAFVLLASLTVMNMLIGVLCEVVSAVAATEKEEMLVNYVNDKLREVVLLLDSDGDMKISKAEFMQILENGDACRCLEDVGVDVIGLIDSVDAIFTDKSYDVNGGDSNLQLDFPKFMEVVLALRGSNNATVKDVVELRKFVRDAMVTTSTELRGMQEQMQVLHASIARMCGGIPFAGHLSAEQIDPIAVKSACLRGQHPWYHSFENVMDSPDFAKLSTSMSPATSNRSGQMMHNGSGNGAKGVRRRRRKGEDCKPPAPGNHQHHARHVAVGPADGSDKQADKQLWLLECLEIPNEHTKPDELPDEFTLQLSDGEASVEDCNDLSDNSHDNNHQSMEMQTESTIDTNGIVEPAGLWSCCPGHHDERKHMETVPQQEQASKVQQAHDLDLNGNGHVKAPAAPMQPASPAKDEKSAAHKGKAYSPDSTGDGYGDDLQFLTMKVGRSMSTLLSDLELMHRVVHARPRAHHTDKKASRTNGNGHRKERRVASMQPDDALSNNSAAPSN